jgi:hypothetical protein
VVLDGAAFRRERLRRERGSMKRPSPTKKRGAKPRRGLNRREFLKTTLKGALVTVGNIMPLLGD